MARVADHQYKKHCNTRTAHHDLYRTSKLPAVGEGHGLDGVRSVPVAIHTYSKEPAELQYGICHGPTVPKHTATPGLRVMPAPHGTSMLPAFDTERHRLNDALSLFAVWVRAVPSTFTEVSDIMDAVHHDRCVILKKE